MDSTKAEKLRANSTAATLQNAVSIQRLQMKFTQALAV